MYQKIAYFKGLDGLRFLAAYMVVLHHAEQIRFKNNLFNLKEFTFFNNGGLAVKFFFVLSGFLISYLLLRERTRTNNISIKKFYLRRILKIWPLYFLLVFIGTLFLPAFLNIINHSYKIPYTFSEVILYYIFFSPFMVTFLFGHNFLEPLWSIGVEELFYIIWAPLFKFAKKHILIVILSVIIFKYILLITMGIIPFPPTIAYIIRTLQFETMAFGGLTAYIIYHKKKKIESNFLFSKLSQIFLMTFIIARIFAGKYLIDNYIFFNYLYNSGLISEVLITLSFAWLIVNISLNSKSIIKLDYNFLVSLGGISYGIYMYHMLIIFGTLLLTKNSLLKMSGTSATIFYYFIITLGVISISSISKKVFENYFLKLKNKFKLNSYQNNTKNS